MPININSASLMVVPLHHSTKIAKVWPGFDDLPEHPSVQIDSSGPCVSAYNAYKVLLEISPISCPMQKLAAATITILYDYILCRKTAETSRINHN